MSIALITIGNLRGLRESGNIFAIPTYLFVGLALLMIAVGVFHIVTGTVGPDRRSPTSFAPPAHRDARACSCCSRRSPADRSR